MVEEDEQGPVDEPSPLLKGLQRGADRLQGEAGGRTKRTTVLVWKSRGERARERNRRGGDVGEINGGRKV